MMRETFTKITRAASALALLAFASACGGGGASNSAQQANASAQPDSSAQSNAGGGAATDVAKLNADIERLEKAAERNPGDDDTRDDLARAYVRRGDAERAAGQPQEAINDYQRALRLDPDNDEAQKNAADTKEQFGGEQEDENGAPAPLPITPNVADEDNKPAPNAKPTATPKKQ
jgi:tetratricopeptide (TPR) repeat protein